MWRQVHSASPNPVISNPETMSVIPLPSLRPAIALTVLRIVLGIVFIAHGWQKVFVFGIDGVTQGFAQMGIPLAGIAAPFISYLELVGGALLVIGLLSRPLAALLGITMIVALFKAHLAAGFFLPNGYEFVLALAAMSLTVFLSGPGSFSVDEIIEKRRVGS